jgi:hypothetical protein
VSGYSGTPLARKLGIRAGARVHVAGAPADYRALLEPLPEDVCFVARATASTDLVHLFSLRRAALERRLPRLRATLAPTAVVWVSWPKRACGVATDVTADVVRAVALPLGFVDVKVCAVDDAWSGLKLVVRRALR